MFCDLHTHSTASDGTETPSEVVRLARRGRIAVLALTDHDTFEGVPEAVDAGRKQGVHVVAGAELSIPHAKGGFHLIALGVDIENHEIRAVAEALRGARGPRNAAMIGKLRDLGVDISLAEVEEEAGGADGVVARPHMATVLLRKGVVRSFQEAFDRYLGRGAAAYVERERPDLAAAVAATRAAGGATVVCHPFTLGFEVPGDPEGDRRFRAWLAGVAQAGVDALEVRYGSYTKRQERYFTEAAAEAGLLPSGGSDFHGAIKPGLRVGSGRGRMRVPVAWFEALSERAASRPRASS